MLPQNTDPLLVLVKVFLEKFLHIKYELFKSQIVQNNKK